MKKICCFIILFTLAVNAGNIAGPKGGKYLQKGDIRAEFVVNSARFVQMYFYDADMNLIMPTEQAVRVLADAGTKKVRIEMDDSHNGFVSTEPLPDGEAFTVLTQIRWNEDSRFTNFRINYEAGRCDECRRGKYACTCDPSDKDQTGR